MRRLRIAAAVCLAVALLVVLDRELERAVHALVETVGGVRALALIAAATVLLAGAWLRYGGNQVLKRWGVEIAPPRDARRVD
jgi:citrate lyase beta subunit